MTKNLISKATIKQLCIGNGNTSIDHKSPGLTSPRLPRLRRPRLPGSKLTLSLKKYDTAPLAL